MGTLELISRTDSEKLAQIQGHYLKAFYNSYMNDIKWTDDYTAWKTKKEDAGILTSGNIDKYNDVIAYWKESNEELNALQAQVRSGETIEEVQAVLDFNPTHIKTKDEITLQDFPDILIDWDGLATQYTPPPNNWLTGETQPDVMPEPQTPEAAETSF